MTDPEYCPGCGRYPCRYRQVREVERQPPFPWMEHVNRALACITRATTSSAPKRYLLKAAQHLLRALETDVRSP